MLGITPQLCFVVIWSLENEPVFPHVSMCFSFGPILCFVRNVMSRISCLCGGNYRDKKFIHFSFYLFGFYFDHLLHGMLIIKEANMEEAEM